MALNQETTPLAFRPKDAGPHIGVSRSKIYELIASGELIARKLDGCTLIPRSELERYLAGLPVAELFDGDEA